ncbi:ABC transporter ATP-binding protein [Athalassotoga saccharophila]|uniref:ABC transporter ATP-binding protein n=1 Tax=Athalassotoga saccharophila TaxID=1441386 RepID=UPI00137A3F13|nr:ABC transporter ATP-binding protein [Athalassotoga saccharophila]BBJ28225.1 ABC transporter ATP-binding protein NatA [Athalassotoga saccharophila]
MTELVKVSNLKKNFGTFTAVKSINFSVKSGEIYGFLGPNGAGKTTTIRMLTGILTPTGGKIEICGLDLLTHPLEVKSQIGVVPDEPKLYENLTGQEFLEFVGSIFSMDKNEMKKRIEELCDAFEINFLEKFIGDYSHGMKQKLMLTSVLMRRPKVIFLDEATVGLDAKSAKILKMLLRKYADEGSSIFMTTHVLEIAEKMCDRIGIINAGEIIAEGTLSDLRNESGKQSLEDIFLQLTGSTDEEVREIIQNL